MRIKANCKINLGLFVTRKRPDGYHELETEEELAEREEIGELVNK